MSGVKRTIAVLSMLALAACGAPSTPAASPTPTSTPSHLTVPTSEPSAEPSEAADEPVMILGRVTTYVFTAKKGKGKPCTSKLAKAGGTVRVTYSGGESAAKLEKGVVQDRRCLFSFSVDAPSAPNYTLIYGKHKRKLTLQAANDDFAVIAIPSLFTKPELAYLKAKSVKPSAKRAEGVVSDGWDSCDAMRSAGGRESRILALMEGEIEVSRRAVRFLCPKYTRDVNAAKYAFEDGDNSVPGDVKPGTYRTFGPTSDCYWERATSHGTIIANNFISFAPKGVRVTIYRSDGAFKSEGCDLWVPV